MPEENIEQEVEIVEVLEKDPRPDSRRTYEDYVKDAVGTLGEEKEQVEDNHIDAAETHIPDKFKGKSLEEVISSYQSLESEYGRRNNEVGSLRKLTDQLLELDKKETPETKREAITVDSLLESPDDVINQSIDNNPRLKALEESMLRQNVAKDKSAFDSKHPEWETTLTSPEFETWVMESKVRQRMLIEADKNYDYETGSELFDMYELAKGSAIKEATTQRNSKARKTAKSGVTEQGGSPKETKSVKKYRRVDLINLKVSNPSEYERRYESEFRQAYIDKRVI